MKSRKSLFLVLSIFSLFFFSNWATDCFCGSHADGIVTYEVVGTDCCRSQPTEFGYEYEYTQQTNGVWQHTGTNQMTGAEASDLCCEE